MRSACSEKMRPLVRGVNWEMQLPVFGESVATAKPNAETDITSIFQVIKELDERTGSNENGHFSETILVVEDEEIVRRLVVETFLLNGFRVLEAKDGRQALDLCKQHNGSIHLVLTDVIMPQMSGPQLAAHLKQLRPETRLIYMSGYPDDAIARLGVLDEGIVSFIRKPFAPAELMCKVGDTLRASKMNSG